MSVDLLDIAEVRMAPGHAAVVLAVEDVPPSGAQTDRYLLADDELASADAMGAHRGSEFLRGRSLLRRLVSALLSVHPREIRLATRPAGRPYVVGHDLGVSISHTARHTAAAAWPDGDVGVDVHEPADRDRGLIERCCGVHAAEVRARPASEQATAFARVWSVQEACAKAVGLGMAAVPWRIRVHPDEPDGQWGDVRWRRLRAAEPAALAVAVRPRPVSAPPTPETDHEGGAA